MEDDKNINVILRSQKLLQDVEVPILSTNVKNIMEDDYTKEAFITLPDTQDENKSDKLKPGKSVPSTISINRQKKLRKYWGLLFTIVAAMQFSLSALIIKVLDYHPFNLGVWRFFVMMLIPIPFLWHAVFWKKQKVFKAFWPLNLTLFYLGIQAVVGSNSLVLLFYALQRLSVADALVISTSAPVFVTLLAFVFLGEKAGCFPFFMAILTLFGVGIICRPPIITGAATFDDNLMMGAALSFGSMFLLATTYVVIRYLRTVHHALINLCFSAWGFLQCVAIAYYLDVLCPPKHWMEILLILATAILAFFAQTCITLALKFEEAGPVSLVRTTEILFAFVWQLIFLGVVPDLFSIIGAMLVISAVVLTAIRKMLINLPEDHKYKKRLWMLLN